MLLDSDMTRLWLVRHGETNWNLEGRYQGTTDIPLNAKGRSQAKALGQVLAANGVPFQAVFSSPLSRARETAGIIARCLDLPVFVDKRLEEINLGEWEGELFIDIREKFPEIVGERLTNAANTRTPGGESAVEVARRVVDAADLIASCHSEEEVILVGHGFSLSVLAAIANGKSLDAVYTSLLPHTDPLVIEWNPSRQNSDG